MYGQGECCNEWVKLAGAPASSSLTFSFNCRRVEGHLWLYNCRYFFPGGRSPSNVGNALDDVNVDNDDLSVLDYRSLYCFRRRGYIVMPLLMWYVFSSVKRNVYKRQG